MSHLHRGRFIRLRHEKNAGRDGAGVTGFVPAGLPATPHVAIGAAAPAVVRKARAKPKAKRKAKR